LNSSPVTLSARESALESAVARAMRRLAPYLMLLYVVSFLDRANIGFAKQALQASVGISESVYAMGAGLFFIGYSLCGFPSNLILHKVGAKRWLTFLMVGWGVVSMATMLVRGSVSFYALRLVLGALEAGFFPGTILYLTYWFPNAVRGRVMGMFYLGVPLALVVGGPLSGWLLEMHPALGIVGWQWMFLIEGLMAVALGISAWWYLDDKPRDAAWLPEEEKRALVESLAGEETERRAEGPAAVLTMLRDVRVMQFLLIYALIQVSTYGAVFYLPAEVSALLHRPEGLEVGLVSAIPWVVTLVAVVLLPMAADRFQEHRRIAAATMLVAGCASFAFPSVGLRMGLVMLSLAVAGFVGVQPLFWTFPTGYMADRAKAGGIGLIGMGNLGGFFAPNLKVWADEYFHSPRAGLYLLAGLTVVNAGLILLVKQRRAETENGALNSGAPSAEDN